MFRRSRVRAVLTQSGWALFGELGLLWFLVFVLETIFWPPWIEASSHGVRIQERCSRRFYPWQRIERFEVGNPSSPRLAYLILGPSLDPADVQRDPVVELPYLCRPLPRDVVQQLSDAQRRFGQPGATA